VMEQVSKLYLGLHGEDTFVSSCLIVFMDNWGRAMSHHRQNTPTPVRRFT
jgi:hypothetical protein